MGDRHEKWLPVEPGHVIPAGQPYRVERADAYQEIANEYRRAVDWDVPPNPHRWFVDSSWKPPLDLPTEPTWGIVILRNPPGMDADRRIDLGCWQMMDGFLNRTNRIVEGQFDTCDPDWIDQFIPLTPEQVKPIDRNHQ